MYTRLPVRISPYIVYLTGRGFCIFWPAQAAEVDSLPPAAAVRVNSFHIQGIGPDMLAAGLQLTATAADGCVEAFESEDGLLHGIQWHPEKMHAEGSVLPMLGEIMHRTCRRCTIGLFQFEQTSFCFRCFLFQVFSLIW